MKSRSSGVQLLADIREAFGHDQNVTTAELLKRLIDRDESPWATVRAARNSTVEV